jgi:hypothetical protein
MGNRKMKSPVLLFSNDFSSAFGKTTEYLTRVCERLGHPAMVSDSFDMRIVSLLLANVDESPDLHLRIERELKEYYDRYISMHGIENIISLDLSWFLMKGLFTDNPRVKNIYSLWFDDIHTWTRAALMKFMPIREGNFQDVIKHRKLTHCFYGQSIADEARILGINNQRISWLAAPQEYLSLNHPCEIKNKAVFIGNPGFRGNPGHYALKKMEVFAEFSELRSTARKELLIALPAHVQTWIKEEPTVKKIFELATQLKVERPFECTLKLLQEAGQTYPQAMEYLNEKSYLMEITQIIKLVNRYYRPAIVLYLYKKGLMDVYSTPSEWAPYGVESQETLNFRELPRHYQKYSVHVNAANPVRDATANEKLFEIAACGRMSINIDSPDVRQCYNTDEICFVNTVDELFSKADYYLNNPEEALAMGEKSRQKTALMHTWDHRLSSILV